MTAARGLLAALRADLAAQADPVRAPAMQAYMKSALPYLGVPTPLLRKTLAAAVARQPLTDTPALAAAMQALWRTARYREERYAALELARPRPHRPLLTLALLPVFEVMIRSGAWWDYCDNASGNEVAALLLRYPREMKQKLRRWATGDDLWLRRAAILCQRGLRAEFDVQLFYDCIAPSIGTGRFADEFFMRKGIGWALRERSYAAPDEVRAYCRAHEAQLAPLTRREALKAIERRRAS
jgi:3-methyladenine DNA glycosylase AlkD